MQWMRRVKHVALTRATPPLRGILVRERLQLVQLDPLTLVARAMLVPRIRKVDKGPARRCLDHLGLPPGTTMLVAVVVGPALTSNEHVPPFGILRRNRKNGGPLVHDASADAVAQQVTSVEQKRHTLPELHC